MQNKHRRLLQLYDVNSKVLKASYDLIFKQIYIKHIKNNVSVMFIIIFLKLVTKLSFKIHYSTIFEAYFFYNPIK